MLKRRHQLNFKFPKAYLVPNHTHSLSSIIYMYIYFIRAAFYYPSPLLQSNIPTYHMSLSHFHQSCYFDFLFPIFFRPSIFSLITQRIPNNFPNMQAFIYCIQQKFFILSLRLDDFFLHLFPAPSETQSNPIYQKKVVLLVWFGCNKVSWTFTVQYCWAVYTLYMLCNNFFSRVHSTCTSIVTTYLKYMFRIFLILHVK